MKHITIVLLLVSFVQMIDVAQDIKVLSGSHISLNGNVYDIYQNEELFKEVPIAYQYFLKSKRDKKDSKVLGYTSLGALSLGAILLNIQGDPRGCNGVICLSRIQGYGLASIFIISPITGIIGLSKRASSRKNFEKATEFYNYRQGLDVPRTEGSYLSIGFSQHGFGLIVNF